MTEQTPAEPTTKPRSSRKWLLTQNSQLRAEGIFNWPLPAFAGRLDDGRTYNTCPEAGACRDLCYARVGSYRFRNVLAAHQMVLDAPDEWARQMASELEHRRYRDKWVRLHLSLEISSPTAIWLPGWTSCVELPR